MKNMTEALELCPQWAGSNQFQSAHMAHGLPSFILVAEPTIFILCRGPQKYRAEKTVRNNCQKGTVFCYCNLSPVITIISR